MLNSDNKTGLIKLNAPSTVEEAKLQVNDIIRLESIAKESDQCHEVIDPRDKTKMKGMAW